MQGEGGAGHSEEAIWGALNFRHPATITKPGSLCTAPLKDVCWEALLTVPMDHPGADLELSQRKFTIKIPKQERLVLGSVSS